MLKEILLIFALTLTPLLELRASIPYGMLSTNLPIFLILLIAIISNILLAILAYELFRFALRFIIHFKRIEKLYHKTLERAQKKVHPYVEKYGTIGLALFIGVPLPGSGAYTGALAATVLNMDRKDYIIASCIGVLIAATAVTIIVLFGNGVFSWALKII